MDSPAQSLRLLRTGRIPAEALRILELVLCLAWRDLRVRYKQSFLGIAWAVVQPLSLMAVFAMVLGPQVGKSVPAGVPYSLFLLAGLVPWAFFSSSLMQCVGSLVANRNLITKLYFPREAFPFSCVAAALVDFGIGLLALGAFLFYWRAQSAWPGWSSSLLFLPGLVLIQTVLTAGLGMALAMANLFYRDIRPVVGIALQLGLFISAVVVPVAHDSSWTSRLVYANPMTGLISGYRDCLLFGSPPDVRCVSIAAIWAAIIFSISWVLFRRASYRFAERI